jgi:hypothetical protein
MNRRRHHTQDSPSQRWARLLRRMLRAEVRASTLSLVIIVAWLVLLAQVWQDNVRIFGQ